MEVVLDTEAPMLREIVKRLHSQLPSGLGRASGVVSATEVLFEVVEYLAALKVILCKWSD